MTRAERKRKRPEAEATAAKNEDNVNSESQRVSGSVPGHQTSAAYLYGCEALWLIAVEDEIE